MKEMNIPIVAILALAAGVASVEILTECPPYDPEGTTVHLPHEFDCTKFYKCFMGEKYEMDCSLDDGGDKLYYNSELQTCDYRSNVTCQNDLLEKCPPAGSSQTLLLPHECNCFKHYECYDGTAIAKTCQPGQMFDYNLKKCVQAEKAMCKSGSRQMSLMETEIDIPSLFECPPKGSHEIKLIPHECICNVYFLCKDGIPIRQECPPETEFDYERQLCGSPHDVNCVRPIRPPPTTTPYPDRECPSDECNYCTIRLPHPTDCSSYIECENGRKVVKKCHDYLLFNPVSDMCDLPEYVKCPSSQKCYPGYRHPDECDCSQYYECSKNGTGTDRLTCPKGQLFDKNKLVCDRADNVNCPGQICYPEQLTPHECHCNEYYECSKDGKTQILRTCPDQYTYDYEQKKCIFSKYAKCWRGQCTPGEFMPHENDCSKYYQCGANGKKVILQNCTSGHLFDCDRKMCVPQQNLGRCCVVIPPHTFRLQDEFLEDIP